MKPIIIIILFFFWFALQANPFASKKNLPAVKKTQLKQNKVKDSKTILDIYFLGKIEAGDTVFGILIFEEKQHILQINEKLLDFKVIRIENEYILLSKYQQIHRIEVY